MGAAANGLFDGMCETAKASESEEDFVAGMHEMLAEPHDKGIVDEDVLNDLIEHASSLFGALIAIHEEHPDCEIEPFMEHFQEVCNEVGDQGGNPDQFEETFRQSFPMS